MDNKVLLKKYERQKLCNGLHSDEFECKCSYKSCRSTIINIRLIKAYSEFRRILGVSLIINSGIRCTQHNFDVGGSPRSRHLTGEAIDISKRTLNHLSDEEIEHAAKIAGFTFIKIYSTFIHLDVR